MSSKDIVLARIREALSVKTDEDVRALSAGGERDVEKARAFMPPGGESETERLSLFLGLSEKLKTRVHVVASMADAQSIVQGIAREEGWDKVGSHHADLTTPIVESLGLHTLWTDEGIAHEDLETVPAGVSVCEALIAQSGSVLVTNRGCGGRALSILPPHHVVIAKRSQLIPDLFAAYQLLGEKYGDQSPSLISFITGPSRTGDIERILVLGAHGPKQLTIVILEDD